MAARKKSKRVLTPAQKRKYKAARIERAKALLVDNAGSHGVSIAEEDRQPTPKERIAIAEGQRDAAYAETREIRDRLRNTVSLEEHNSEVNSLRSQNGTLTDEVTFLRDLLSRIGRGGVHVRSVERVAS